MSRTFFLFALGVSTVFAQQTATIEGEVVDSSGNGVANLTALLCINNICGEQVQVNSGRFRFQMGAARGHYVVEIHSISGETLQTQAVYADANQPPMRIQLADSVLVTTTKAAGPISISRLRHHAPKAATKELERALASFRKNEPQDGTEHLEKALVADPEFLDAHYLLGLSLEANGFTEQALPHLENAAPSFPKAHVFAAKILSRAGREKEAQTHLRKYLQTGDLMYRERVMTFLK